MGKLMKHLKIVRTHRKFVCKWCFKLGIPLRGLLHDLSKYSLKELSICKYYIGTRSPHEIMREQIGYSNSWYHHRNRNKHHWEYWIDALQDKTAVKMPYKYVIEMLCDMAGAGQAYNRNNWMPCDVKKYYDKNNGPHRIINADTKKLFEYLLSVLASFEKVDDFFKWYKHNKKHLKKTYKLAGEYDINDI